MPNKPSPSRASSENQALGGQVRPFHELARIKEAPTLDESVYTPACLACKMEIPVHVHCRMPAMALVVCGRFSASSLATVDLDAARKSVVEGEKAVEEKRFADSAHAYAAAMDTGIQCPDIAYSAAEAYSRAGDPKSAFNASASYGS